MTSPIKMLILGNSGAGKTGMLPSLINSGYNIRLLDADGGAPLVRGLISPETTSSLSVITLSEKMSSREGFIYPENPRAWIRLASAVTGKWKDDDGQELPPIVEWTDRDVLVIDTLYTVSRLAYYHMRKINNRVAAEESGMLWRSDIGSAQNLIISLVDQLHGNHIKCNVVVNTHIERCYADGSVPNDVEKEKARKAGISIPLPGWPSVVGKAACPRIPRYFPDVLYVSREGKMAFLYTTSRDDVGLKASAPSKVRDRYPQLTGLSDYFADIKGEKKCQ